MRRMKKRGPNVLYDLNDLLFFLTGSVDPITVFKSIFTELIKGHCTDHHVAKPCPHWRLQSSNLVSVAEFGDKLWPFPATNSATIVSSVDSG